MREDFDILREMVERILGASCVLFFGGSRCQTHANECMQEFHTGNPIKATANCQRRYKVLQNSHECLFRHMPRAYARVAGPATSDPRGGDQMSAPPDEVSANSCNL